MAMLSKTVIMKGILQYVQQPSNTSLRQTKRDTTCLLPATSGDATWSTRTGNRLWSVVWWQQPGGSPAAAVPGLDGRVSDSGEGQPGRRLLARRRTSTARQTCAQRARDGMKTGVQEKPACA